MRIVFATGIFPPDIGGPATYVNKLALDCVKRGFDVKIITYADNSVFKSQIPNFNIQSNPKSQIPIIKISRNYPVGLRHFLYFWKLLFLTRNADVIYAQNVTSAGLPALLAAKLFQKRFILKIVGDAAWERNRGYLRAVQGAVARFAGNIIVPSLYLKKMVVGWGVAGEKIEVIHNAPEPIFLLDISKNEAKEKLGLSGNIILSVGRPVPWKGFSDLIAIMPDLLLQNPNFQLVIVGAGKEKFEAQERVKLVGGVPHSEMPLYFKAADMFVLNSGYEGLSHVILEAMQHEVPVIASSEGGNPELIENGLNGFLVEYKNQEQLRGAILKLWQDKNLQEKFIQNSKEKLKNFSWENLVEETLKILQ